jgi:hypothetical protein
VPCRSSAVGGSVSELRARKALRLTSLAGEIPCRLLEDVILEFRAENNHEASVELENLVVPTRELWTPSLLGRDFLIKSGWRFSYQPRRAVCELEG